MKTYFFAVAAVLSLFAGYLLYCQRVEGARQYVALCDQIAETRERLDRGTGSPRRETILAEASREKSDALQFQREEESAGQTFLACGIVVAIALGAIAVYFATRPNLPHEPTPQTVPDPGRS